ncbi:MAG: hypothetical protein ACR2GY_01045 [Phycisphaerales bacterium]
MLPQPPDIEYLPGVRAVIVTRLIAAAAIRLVGVFLLIFSTVPLFSWMLEGFRDSDLANLTYYAPRALTGGYCLILGLLMLCMTRFLVRKLIPLPKPECPDCGYRLDGLSAGRCPECGIAILRVRPGATTQHDDDEEKIA